MRAEPHTWENLGNHQSQKFWLFTWLSIRTSVHTYVCTPSPIPWKIREYHHYHRYVFDNGPSCIRWPVPRDHIAGLGEELIEVTYFLLTRYWVFNWIVDSTEVIHLGEREGVHTNAKYRRKLNPDALLTFLPTYSLHNRFLESSWYIGCVRNLYSLWVHSLGTVC